jgi:hypothetical protein
MKIFVRMITHDKVVSHITRSQIDNDTGERHDQEVACNEHRDTFIGGL